MGMISSGGQFLLFLLSEVAVWVLGSGGGVGSGGCEACQILMSLTQQKTLFRSFQIWLDHRNQDGQ